MARKKSRSFTEVELKFMQILWDRGEASPDDIGSVLSKEDRSISAGSIRNVLAIMIRKGYISRRKEGKAYLYSPVIEKNEARENLIGDMLSDMFEGSAALMVASLFEAKNIPDKDFEAISRLIEKHKRGKEEK